MNRLQKRLRYSLKSNINVLNKNYKNEQCHLSSFFYFLSNGFPGISFLLWKINSTYFAKKIFEKFISLSRILKTSKSILIAKFFSSKRSKCLDQGKIIQCSKVMSVELKKLLGIYRTTLFLKFVDKLKIVFSKIFGFKIENIQKILLNKFCGFVEIHFGDLYHANNSLLFFNLNNISMAISNIWLISNRNNEKFIPWWRKLKMRECELEFVCNEVVKKICNNLKRRIS